MNKNIAENLPAEQQETYSPALTEKVKRAAVAEIVKAGREMLVKNPVKINLNDTEQLINVTDEYLSRCIRIGVLPTLQGVAAACGVSRRMIYKYLEEHEGTQSADYLERLRAAFTQMRIEAVDKNAAKEVMSIFLLKNSSQGFTDRLDIQPVQQNDPMRDLDAEAARRRMLAALPEDDDD